MQASGRGSREDTELLAEVFRPERQHRSELIGSRKNVVAERGIWLPVVWQQEIPSRHVSRTLDIRPGAQERSLEMWHEGQLLGSVRPA